MKKKYTYLELGKKLKDLRNNLTQKEFAAKISVPLVTYQRYESGERLPPGAVLSRVAELCGKTVDWLLGRDLESVIAAASAKKAESDKYWGQVSEKISSGLGVPMPQDPESIAAFNKVLAFYEQHGINILNLLKWHAYTQGEQELMDMLVAVLRGENVDNRKAIIENIKAFYKTRNVVDMDCPGELKKTNHAG